MAKSRAPTKAELKILQVLWRDGPQSVRDVQRVLARTREVVLPTTTGVSPGQPVNGHA